MVEKRNLEREEQFNLAVDVLMLAGTLLLQSGSEIYRVEDTMIRIAHSQGIIDCNALAMPVAIFFSIENTNISRMKRITHSNYNIEKVCDVNQVSRELVSGDITLEGWPYWVAGALLLAVSIPHKASLKFFHFK